MIVPTVEMFAARDQRQFIFYCRCAYGSAFWQPACYFALAHRPLRTGT
jgi:hypothetical protein